MKKLSIWLGPIIAIAACISYLLFFSQFPLTRDDPWLSLGLGAFGLFLSFIAIFAWRKSGWFNRFGIGFGFIVSVIFTGFLFVYVFVWSSQLPAAPKVANFANVKSLPLKATGGKTITLSDYPNKQIVVSFFRGYW